MSLAVQAQDVTVSYGGHLALAPVSLRVQPHRVSALVGPSGCGKTSFLRCLNRLTDLVPSCTVGGTIRVGGEDIHAPGTDVLALRRRVGMVFQRPNPFPLSIRRNLELPLREHGLRDRAALAERVETGLRDVGLWDEVRDRLDRPALSLSGGQQQRLCIARALVLRPEVLLMDEPCSALDPLSGGVVEDRIAALRERLTVVLVTHNLAQARRLADTLAVFWTADGVGQLIASGPATEVFEDPADPRAAAYLSGRQG